MTETNAILAKVENDLIHTSGNQAFADSRDIAKLFEKEHKSVLRAIRNLLADAPRLHANFAPFKIKDLTGESTSHYEMDRTGLTMLVMGFTGTKALKFKRAFIKAFNRMEAEIKRRRAQIEQDPAAAARAWADEYEKRRRASAKAIAAG